MFTIIDRDSMWIATEKRFKTRAAAERALARMPMHDVWADLDLGIGEIDCCGEVIDVTNEDEAV